MKNIGNYVKKIRFDDLKSICYIIAALIPAAIIRLRKKQVWLLAERPNVADGNSWCFFKWLGLNHPEIDAYFLLDRKAYNFELDNRHMIPWGSLRHYIYFIASKYQISDFFGGTQPNIRICGRFKKILKQHDMDIFLQHGTIKDSCESFTYDKTGVRLFICGAEPEYAYFKKYAGYPEGYIKYTGLARFDDLLINRADKKYILLIPTWRRYVGNDDEKSEEENTKDFLDSIYYKKYNELLNNQRLIEFLRNKNIKLKFCIHERMRKYINYFQIKHSRIEMVESTESIHKLIMECSILITDYSSVFFDAAYAEKPVIYYHFDYAEFRSKHFGEGYFSYENDGVGPVAYTEDELITLLEKAWCVNHFIRDDIYVKRSKKLQPLHDTDNCKRIFDEIVKLK